jgi:hypothetical protein
MILYRFLGKWYDMIVYQKKKWYVQCLVHGHRAAKLRVRWVRGWWLMCCVCNVFWGSQFFCGQGDEKFPPTPPLSVLGTGDRGPLKCLLLFKSITQDPLCGMQCKCKYYSYFWVQIQYCNILPQKYVDVIINVQTDQYCIVLCSIW